MKTNRARVIAVFLSLGMMIFSDAGFAKEPPPKERNRSHIEIDPQNTGTYTGEPGKDNYIANCSPCHGLTGRGDGPLADSLGAGVIPSKLNDAKLLSTRTEEFLFKAIKFGGISVGLTESMPGWKDTFTDTEIKQITQYIRSNICKCTYNDKK
ncbi:MAG: cytochrome c [Gallionella sp.]|nr:cytochrome c [Gallionella sp.]